jgi:hypothetical protein
MKARLMTLGVTAIVFAAMLVPSAQAGFRFP